MEFEGKIMVGKRYHRWDYPEEKLGRFYENLTEQDKPLFSGGNIMEYATFKDGFVHVMTNGLLKKACVIHREEDRRAVIYFAKCGAKYYAIKRKGGSCLILDSGNKPEMREKYGTSIFP